MRNVILFDDFSRDNLLPFTLNKPVCELLVGATNIRQKWELAFNSQCSFITQDYLADKFPINIEDTNYVVNGSVLPTKELLLLVNELEDNNALTLNGELIAAKLDSDQFKRLMQEEEIEELLGHDLGRTPMIKINHKWDLFIHNEQAIKFDFELLSKNKSSEVIPSHVVAINKEQIFIEENVQLEHCILDASKGPIYIGEGTVIMHGACVKGPFSTGKNCQLKMGLQAYGPTCLGNYVKAGGEIKESTIMNFSNKGHGGFLGNSAIGEWCNLGANTNTSNMKNNYGEVNVWNRADEKLESSGLQFCGLFMGDHSKVGISTMFNTGSVVGFATNIFGNGQPEKATGDFDWVQLGSKPVAHQLPKAIETAKKMMARRGEVLSEKDVKIWETIFESSSISS